MVDAQMYHARFCQIILLVACILATAPAAAQNLWSNNNQYGVQAPSRHGVDVSTRHGGAPSQFGIDRGRAASSSATKKKRPSGQRRRSSNFKKRTKRRTAIKRAKSVTRRSRGRRVQAAIAKTINTKRIIPPLPVSRRSVGEAATARVGASDTATVSAPVLYDEFRVIDEASSAAGAVVVMGFERLGAQFDHFDTAMTAPSSIMVGPAMAALTGAANADPTAGSRGETTSADFAGLTVSTATVDAPANPIHDGAMVAAAAGIAIVSSRTGGASLMGGLDRIITPPAQATMSGVPGPTSKGGGTADSPLDVHGGNLRSPGSPRPRDEEQASGLATLDTDSNRRPAEVLALIDDDVDPPAFADLLNVEILAQQTSALLQGRVLRLRIKDLRSIDEVVRAAIEITGVVAATPNHVYALQEEGWEQARYSTHLIKLSTTRTIEAGRSVRVGIIDTAVEAGHPALRKAIHGMFDGLPGQRIKQTRHATAVAGLIAGRSMIKGVAPESRLLIARAFDGPSADDVRSDAHIILASLDWLALQSVHIANLSFAGPANTLLERALDAAATWDHHCCGSG